MPATAVNPSLGVILPRGAARGGEVEVRFQGGNLADAVGLLFHDDGLSLVELTSESDKVVRAKIAIAPDCVPGPKAIRVRTKTGVSNPRLFSVGALKELEEAEPNGTREEAQRIELNATVNGVVPSEDVDYFAFDLEQGARIAVEVEGLRLGDTLFDPKLRLFGPGGHERVSEDDTPLTRQDAAFVYTAQESGTHYLAVSEASYGGAGNCYYRLHVGTFPRPLSATPLGGAPEQEVSIHWLGDPGVASQAVTLPAHSGTYHLPVRLEPAVTPSPMPFRVSTLPGVLEKEPNDTPDTATEGAAPGAFDGVIQAEGDTDWFQFQGTNGMKLEIRVWARELGSPLDSVMTVLKPSGEGLASNDDAAGLDSLIRTTLPEDGLYKLSITDQLGNGGATFAYRVEAAAVAPAVRLGTPDNENVALTVPQDNRAFLLLSASRQDFNAPLSVAFEGLPAGVTVEHGAFAPSETRLPVIFTAAPDATVAGALVPVKTQSTDESVQVAGGLEQSFTFVEGANRTVFLDRTLERLAVAVSEPAPFEVTVVSPQTPIVRSGSKPITITAKRAEGFNEAIALKFPWMPPGLAAPSGSIPEGQNETTVRLEANGNAALGSQPLVVEGSAGGFTVCSAFSPVEVSEPWVTFELAAIEGVQGQSLEYVVKVSQATPFEGKFAATLFNLPKGVTSAEQELASDAAELHFPLTLAEDAPPGKHENIGLETTLKVSEEPIAHYAGGGQLTIQKPLPPELKEAQPKPEEKKPDEPERKTRFPTTQ